MDNFESKIKKIKSTIEDIKFDIDAIKHKNGSTISKMISSISNVDNNQPEPYMIAEREIDRNRDRDRHSFNKPLNGSYLSDISFKRNPQTRRNEKVVNVFEEGREGIGRFRGRQDNDERVNLDFRSYKQQSSRSNSRTRNLEDENEHFQPDSKTPTNLNRYKAQALDKSDLSIDIDYSRSGAIGNNLSYGDSAYSQAQVKGNKQETFEEFKERKRQASNSSRRSRDLYEQPYNSEKEVDLPQDRKREKLNKNDGLVKKQDLNYDYNIPPNDKYNEAKQIGEKRFENRKNENTRSPGEQRNNQKNRSLTPDTSALKNRPFIPTNSYKQRIEPDYLHNPDTPVGNEQSKNILELEAQINELQKIVSNLQAENKILQREIKNVRDVDLDKERESTKPEFRQESKRNNNYYNHQRQNSSTNDSNPNNNLHTFDQNKDDNYQQIRNQGGYSSYSKYNNYKNDENNYSQKTERNEPQYKPYSSSNIGIGANSASSNPNNIKYEKIVREMQMILGNLESEDDVIPKFKDYLRKFKTNKLKDEFIDKLSNIYHNLSYVNDESSYNQGDDIIKSLWRWIKIMIKNKKNGPQVEEKIVIDRRAQDFVDFCEAIILDYGLRSQEEFFDFINDILSKTFQNKKRVEKIKKLLLTEKNQVQ